ncbi:ribokinase [Sorangium cellulosum]|uniref:Ribokinase n=1 Tax=Sorangium cellulosum TaxID=56 RepID=A0A4P2PUA0_SORCE|nr:ribokinase [Sorangium cellulosum]AUX20214.1 ribokinase [Sorangium cellulosum]
MGLLAICGSITADLIGYGPRLPRPGESVLGRRFLTAPGGKGANQAVAAARMGARVRLVGARGDDAHGALCAAALAADGVDQSAVVVHRGVTTGVALICVDEAGENQILALPGANALVAPPSPCGASVWLCQGEIPTEAVAGVLSAARADGALSICNPSPVNAIDPALVGQFDLAVVNELEHEALRGRLPERVVLTRGARGAVMLPSGEALPALPARAVDTTGAGDALTGVLAAGLAAGMELGAALRRAIAAAGLSVEREGCQPSYPTRAEVERRLDAARSP